MEKRRSWEHSSAGTAHALSLIVFTFAWSTYHYFRAMRTLREEEIIK